MRPNVYWGKMNTQTTATTGTVCNRELFQFPAVKKRLVAASFSGGDVTSDGGLPLLRQMDRRLGLTKAIAQVLPDPRDPALIEHSQHSLLRQRIYGLCHGYEDLNDHDTLRLDPVWQTAVEQIKPLASSPTLCRLENRADRAALGRWLASVPAGDPVGARVAARRHWSRPHQKNSQPPAAF